MPGPTALLHAANVDAPSLVPLCGIALQLFSSALLPTGLVAAIFVIWPAGSRFSPRVTAVNIFRECA